MSGINMNNHVFTQYVCNRLKWAIKERTDDLKDMSKETGISMSLLHRYIHGDQLPSLINMLNICWYLDIDIDDIYDSDLFGQIKRY